MLKRRSFLKALLGIASGVPFAAKADSWIMVPVELPPKTKEIAWYGVVADTDATSLTVELSDYDNVRYVLNKRWYYEFKS